MNCDNKYKYGECNGCDQCDYPFDLSTIDDKDELRKIIREQDEIIDDLEEIIDQKNNFIISLLNERKDMTWVEIPD